MSEEIGKKLAEISDKSASPFAAKKVADMQRAELNAQIQASLKASILEAINGFNKASQGPMKLFPVDGGNRMMLNFGEVLTLTVIFRDQALDLMPRTKSATNVPQKVQVVSGNDAFQYHFTNSNPTVRTPLLSQDQLVEGIIKMALDQAL